MCEHTFRLYALFSTSQLPGLVVCAPVTASMVVHHGAPVLLLEQQVEPNVRLPALRHAARAHMRRWARPEPWDGLLTKAQPHGRVPHSGAAATGNEDGRVEAPGGAAAGHGRPQKKNSQLQYGGRVPRQWAPRSSSHEDERSSCVVSRANPT